MKKSLDFARAIRTLGMVTGAGRPPHGLRKRSGNMTTHDNTSIRAYAAANGGPAGSLLDLALGLLPEGSPGTRGHVW